MTGENNIHSDNSILHTLKITHATPAVEDDSQLHTLPETECQTASDDLMARRLKNRERQRRYRARKRLEAEMSRSPLIEQRALLPTQSQLTSTNINLQPQHGSVLPAAVPSDLAAPGYEARVYCGRKWKKDARRAHGLKEAETQASPSPFSVKPHVEAETNLDCSLCRRDWKADARNKLGIGPHEKGPND